MKVVAPSPGNGDLNNTSAARKSVFIKPDELYMHKSLAIPYAEDTIEAEVRKAYRPFVLSPEIMNNDWISKLELSTAMRMADEEICRTGDRLKVLVLYGSLRSR